MRGKIEMELAELDEADRGAFLADLGLDRAGARPLHPRRLRAARPDQLPHRRRGRGAAPGRSAAAPPRCKAAGKIHSDIERGFIRAEVVAYDEFMRYGSEAKCREAGKLRLEGKEYVVADGDIIHFRFNV